MVDPMLATGIVSYSFKVSFLVLVVSVISRPFNDVICIIKVTKFTCISVRPGVCGDFVIATFVFGLTQLTPSFAGGTIVAALNLLKERGVNSKQIKVVKYM